MSEAKNTDLKKDVDEVKSLLSQSTRPNVKQYLSSYLTKLESDLDKLEKAAVAATTAATSTQPTTTPTSGYTKVIDSYGWDQSDKFMKIYITSLKDLNKVNQANGDVVCNFREKSFDLLIKNLNNVNYTFAINNLLNEISPNESNVKVKSDMITITIRKKRAENWAALTEKDHKAKEARKPKLDENVDPQESLMTLMKQMYEDGDDEMKRTIAKSFIESREKQNNFNL